MLNLLTISLALLSVAAWADPTSICGIDERVPHQDARIGRMKLPELDSGCTGTLIGPDCAITAGHCLNHMKDIEFNVPPSNKGQSQRAAAADIYEIDQASIVFNEKSSDDWAVFKIKKNKLSKKFPGEVYGYFPVNFTEPRAGEEIVISGYGRDLRGEGDFNFTLQTHQGPLIDTHTPYFGKALTYKVDTEGGNSGSAIIRVKEQDIIGIHTHGGCDSIENHGTAFFARLKLQEAIKNCLK